MRRLPSFQTIGRLIGARDDFEEMLWHVREVSGFVEQTHAWGDEAERWFWRAVLEGLLYGPQYTALWEESFDATHPVVSA